MASTHNIEYKIRPAFNAKFRPAEATPVLEKVITDTMMLASSYEDTKQLAKAIADKSKSELRALKKDERYKFIVQVTLGENNGQGFRVGARNYFDEDTDDVCYVSKTTEKYFVLVIAYAVYMYWGDLILVI